MIQWRARRGVLIILALAIAVVADFCLGEIGTVRWPSILAPMPATLAIPAFFTADSWAGWLVLALPAVLFLMWTLPTRDWTSAIPKKSVVLARVVGALSAAWFAFGWRWAIHYQGWSYTVIVAVLSLFALVFLERLRARQAAAPSDRVWLIYHCLVFAWVFTYAFPWLGETP